MKFWQRLVLHREGSLFVILAFAMGLWGSAALDYVRFCSSSAGWHAGASVRRVCLAGRFSAHLEHDRLQRDRASGSLYLEPAASASSATSSCAIYAISFRSSSRSSFGLPRLRYSRVSGSIPAHGIVLNMRLKSVYNPGLFAGRVLQLPVAIVFIWCVLTFMPEAANQLWWGIPVRSCCWASRSACRSSSCMTAILRIRSKSESFGELQARVRCEGLGRAQGCRSGRSRPAFRRVSSAKRRESVE